MIACLWAYRNCYQGEFVFDDHQVILSDRFEGWLPGPQSEFEARWTAYWATSLNWRMGGFAPFGYHVFNVAIHLGNSLLLFRIVARCTRSWSFEQSQSLAFWVSLLWAVHPLQTQSVTYIIQRCESLMAWGILMALFALSKATDSRWRTVWQVLAVASFGLALGGKETALVGVVLFPLFDRAYLSPDWQAVGKKWPLWTAFSAVAACKLFAMRQLFDGNQSAFSGPAVASSWEYLRSQPSVLVHYLKLSLWPSELCLDYRWPIIESPLMIYGWGAVILGLLTISVTTFVLRPRVGFLALAPFIILAPTSSFVPIADLCVEHRMYLPLAPLIALVLAGAILHWPIRLGADSLRILLAFATIAMCLRTIHRNRDYHDEAVLWRSCVAINPVNSRAYYNLGFVLERRGKLPEAEKAYFAASELGHDRAPNNLGVVLASQGKSEEAERAYVEAIQRDEKTGYPHGNYGRLKSKLGDFAEAERLFRVAADRSPKLFWAWGDWAMLMHRQGKTADAIAILKAGIKHNPSQPYLQLRLAWVFSTATPQLRDAARAMGYANAANAAGNDTVFAQDVAAVAFAAHDDFPNAIKHARRALELATDSSPPQAAAIRRRLTAYESGKAYVQEPQSDSNRREDSADY